MASIIPANSWGISRGFGNYRKISRHSGTLPDPRHNTRFRYGQPAITSDLGQGLCGFQHVVPGPVFLVRQPACLVLIVFTPYAGSRRYILALIPRGGDYIYHHPPEFHTPNRTPHVEVDIFTM